MHQEAFSWSSAESFFKILLGDDCKFNRIFENGESISHECLLPPSIGTGRIEYLEVCPDFKIVILDCTWHSAKEMRIWDGGWVRFNFSKRTDVDVLPNGAGAEKLALSLWNIISIPKDICSLERVKPGAKTSFLTAACSREYVSRISGIPEKNLPHPLHTLCDEHTCEAHVSAFELTQQIGLATEQAIHADLESGLRISFIVAKTNELICLSLNNLLSQKPEYPRSFVKLTKSDNQKIRKAKAYLDESLQSRLSVEDLAAAVGINRNKLFYGFKFLTGQTVFQYLQEMRLKHSYELLVNTNMEIGKISNQVGFRHQCNFSTAFRRFFGVSPTSLRSGGEARSAARRRAA